MGSKPFDQIVHKNAVVSYHGLDKMEAKYRAHTSNEIIPFAKRTSYSEIARNFPDRTMQGRAEDPMHLRHRLFILVSRHEAVIGIQALLIRVRDYLQLLQEKHDMDILSVSGGLDKGSLYEVSLIRLYDTEPPDFQGLYDFLGTKWHEEEREAAQALGTIDPPALINRSESEINFWEKEIKEQTKRLQASTAEKPFLNQVNHYTRQVLEKYDTSKLPMYRIKGLSQKSMIISMDEFEDIFEEAMRYVTGVEMDAYVTVLRGHGNKTQFMSTVRDYLIREFVRDRKTLQIEDVEVVLDELHKGLFELYVLQELIDDEKITDIKITDPYSVRVRIYGKAYLSDATFIDEEDYLRFVNALIIRNHIDDSVPEQTFTDDHDSRYKLRFTITMPYISSNGFPVLHIRKISRHKAMAPDLIRAGMMDEKIRDYLLDCGRLSSGVIFAGPPGSGKTTILNWFLEEAYEDLAELLVIQENDELYSNKKGVVFQTVVLNPTEDQEVCTLEDLGQLALVSGANVFVIGEVKGAEICSAITLANSGCRTAMTVHSRSATETLDKMADLALRGYAVSYEQAKRMMQCFQTIVFLQDFRVEEIAEVVGFDEERKDVIYRPIYKREGAE